MSCVHSIPIDGTLRDVIEEKLNFHSTKIRLSYHMAEPAAARDRLQFHLRSSFFLLKVSQLDIDSFLIMLAYMR